jgi:hypothetical protein
MSLSTMRRANLVWAPLICDGGARSRSKLGPLW